MTRPRFLAALALATALTAPAVVCTLASPSSAVASNATTTDLSNLAAKVTPAVVNVAVATEASNARREMQDLLREFPERFAPWSVPQQLPPLKRQAGGSGFIIDPAGWIVTNYHVAGKASSIVVTLSDGRKLEAKLIGSDEQTDLALLKVEAGKPLPYVQFGDSAKVRVGQPVMAVGNPFGLGGTVTMGIVSARGRDLGSGPFDDFIQTDAAINSGNSGGPLFDMEGKVVGINTAIFSPNGGNIGLAFAIPSSLAESVIMQLKEHGRVERGLLGVVIQPVTIEIAESLSLGSTNGALVASVEPDSPASEAGIRPGDVIKSVDGKSMDSVKALTRTIAAARPGSTVEIGLWRDSKDITVQAELGESRTTKQASADDHLPAVARSFGLSLAPITPEMRQELGLTKSVTGVLIAAVEPGSAAEDQGLQPGDVLQQIGRDPVQSPEQAAELLKETRNSNKPVLMKIYRQGMAQFVALSPRAA